MTPTTPPTTPTPSLDAAAVRRLLDLRGPQLEAAARRLLAQRPVEAEVQRC